MSTCLWMETITNFLDKRWDLWHRISHSYQENHGSLETRKHKNQIEGSFRNNNLSTLYLMQKASSAAQLKRHFVKCNMEYDSWVNQYTPSRSLLNAKSVVGPWRWTDFLPFPGFQRLRNNLTTTTKKSMGCGFCFVFACLFSYYFAGKLANWDLFW